MGSFKSLNMKRDFDNNTFTLPIVYPGQGDTGETLSIRSRYSKEFRESEAKALRQLSSMTQAAKGKELDADIVKDINDRSFAKLVAGWSFEEECTEENVIEFLEANPQIYDMINSKAAQDSLFLEKEETK